MNPIFRHLIPPAETLFFSRNDQDDPRVGEIVGHDAGTFPGVAGAVLIGVPQDIGVRRNNGRPGAGDAPDAVRAMLYRLTPYDAETRQSVPDGFLFDAGNLDCSGELEEIHERLEGVVAEVCRAGLLPIVIGGGHDITYAAASGVCAVHSPLGMFNFDAHLDVRPPGSAAEFRHVVPNAHRRRQS